ncbi:MAG: PD-(D/E)XK nuclease family protein [Bacteroidota bacterium]
MHETFLEEVLSDLAAQGYDITACRYILPSKRSAFFLKRHLQARVSQTIFAPDIFAIEDFIGEITSLTLAPSIELLMELFHVYQNRLGAALQEDFHSFSKWGQTLLQDFNEIDRYLIPADDILNYLKAIKEIDHWSVQERKTEMVENYLALWSQLHPIYQEFNTRLKSKQKGYQGSIYRDAVNHLDTYLEAQDKSPIIFIGFNALNNAESAIIQKVLEHGSSEIYWDIDESFLSDSYHDAGLFIRQYVKHWPYYNTRTPKGIRSHLNPSPQIHITGVPKDIVQIKKLSEQLGELQTKDLDHTAVVLAHEALLSPLLSSLPGTLQDVNITMGLPLQDSPLANFFNLLLEIKSLQNAKGWPKVLLQKLFSNPYCRSLIPNKKDVTLAAYRSFLNTSDTLFVSTKMLLSLGECPVLFDLVLTKSPKMVSILDDLLEIIETLRKASALKNQTLELEQLFRFYTIFNQIKSYQETYGFLSSPNTLKPLFDQLCQSETLDILGDPVDGLQIMGMLESRVLDYETIFMTSVNEGVLPAGKSNNSFIPFDVKRAYGLPTYKEKDAIYVYHFYRLLQRAKNVHLFYNTEPDTLMGGERSRLISQLLTDARFVGRITHTLATPKVRATPNLPNQVLKTPLLQEKLKQLAISGFSPSSLSVYIQNPWEFYQRYVLRLNEPEISQETIAPNLFGTIIHDILHALYLPFLGRTLDASAIQEMKSRLSQAILDMFVKHLPDVNLKVGRFLLVHKVVNKYLAEFIKWEERRVAANTIKIVALEERYEMLLDLPELDSPIKLKGFLDRVEDINGIRCISDYKTGRVTPAEVKISNSLESISESNKTKAFQLLCYSLLYSKNHDLSAVQGAIYPIKTIRQGLLPLSIDRNTILTAQDMVDFETQLKTLIREILNPKIDFSETRLLPF